MSLVVRIVNNGTPTVQNNGFIAPANAVIYTQMNDKLNVILDSDEQNITHVHNDVQLMTVGATGVDGIESAQLGYIAKGGVFHVLRSGSG